MTGASTALAAPLSSSFDGGFYRWVTTTAQHTPGPVNDTIRFFSNYGLGIFAVLMLLALWRARPLGPAQVVQTLAVPLTVVVAFLANDVIKSLFDEQRPCQTLHTVTVETCPALGDYSFPSNHTVIAATAATALLLINRRLGLVAVPLAVLIGASRVWIGVHYPHDVLAGLVVGALIGALLTLLVRRFAPRVEQIGPLNGLLNGRLLSSRPAEPSSVRAEMSPTEPSGTLTAPSEPTEPSSVAPAPESNSTGSPGV